MRAASAGGTSASRTASAWVGLCPVRAASAGGTSASRTASACLRTENRMEHVK